MTTLVIHPKDRSTDFLKPIYENLPNCTVITGDIQRSISKNDIHKLIESHDRVIMLGHGCPVGLFSMGLFKDTKRGLIIDEESVPYLKGKTQNIYVWCNADLFVNDFNLKGFYSGMFISEVEEAWACDVPHQSLKSVKTSNDTFSQIMSKYSHETSSVIHENVVREYSELAQENRVADYNVRRLYCNLPDVPVIDKDLIFEKTL